METCQIAVLSNDSNKRYVVRKDVNVIRRRYRNSDLELIKEGGLTKSISRSVNSCANLSREVEFSIQRLKVLDSFTSNELLIEPNLVICARPW